MDTLTIIMLSQHQPRAALRYESATNTGNTWCPVCIIASDKLSYLPGWEWMPLYAHEPVCWCCGTMLEDLRELA